MNDTEINTVERAIAHLEALINGGDELGDVSAEDADKALDFLQAELKRLVDQMNKLSHLASEKNAAVIAEMYIADWDAVRAETAQARTQLAIANARIAELEASRQWVSVVERLPDTTAQVLCKGQRRDGKTAYEVGRYIDGISTWLTSVIIPTHWQEIGPAPEVE